MKKIGITTTIPSEVLFAAGVVPVDLNNVFITDPDPKRLVAEAEDEGLPRNLCSWVKGIYAVLLKNPDINEVIAVTEGDCANTLAMLDLLTDRGIKVITFSYPFNRDPDALDRNITRLEKYFDVNREETEKWRHRLNMIRAKALELDRLTWQKGAVPGFDNHLALISLSDCNGDPDEFERWLDGLIEEAESREPFEIKHRLGYCGVPTVFKDLYDFLETRGARVIFNEMQRQFAMPFPARNIVEQYLAYTYPYDFPKRLKDIKEQITVRRLDGMIHYVQSFCHHQIHDRRLKNALGVPVLTLEGDKPTPLMERTKIRLESFIEMMEMKTVG